MKFNISNRQFLSAAILVFYLIPLFFFSAYSIQLMSHHKSWALLSLGLLMVSFGTLSLMFLLFYWEQSIREKKTPDLPVQPKIYLSLEKEPKVTSFDSLTSSELLEKDSIEETKEISLLRSNKEELKQLFESLEKKQEELKEKEEKNEQLQQEIQKIAQDFADYKLFSEEQLKQKQLQINSLQQTIEDQRSEMEKRQEQIHQLDTKVHDLSYEIKTLLYLHEEEVASSKPSVVIKEELPSPFLSRVQISPLENSNLSKKETQLYFEGLPTEASIQTATEASLLLRKCVNIAQKLTGAHYYSNEASRYREFSSSYFAIDQRQLFDSLRNETRALMIFYSQKEQKLLFANQESKTLLGWSPEKFVSDFSSIIIEGIQEWKRALLLLRGSSDSNARVLAKTKEGQEIILNCHLGLIPTGLFRNDVIGVLYREA